MLLNFCAALLSWLFPARDKAYSALRWWQQRQTDRLHHGAELIRDGILQELFAIRRGLELAHDNQELISEGNLSQLNALHRQLERISNVLCPAFSRDSLPLAVQHALTQWGDRHPDTHLSIQLPSPQLSSPQLASSEDTSTQVQLSVAQTSIPPPVVLSSRVALMALEELLTLLDQATIIPNTMAVQLEYLEAQATLTVRIQDIDPKTHKAIAHLTHLDHLCESFRVLTEGTAQQQLKPSWAQWQFSWSLDSLPQ